VLQGEGITLILDGGVSIKKGVTTSSFNTVPDAPVSSFEAILPEGPHSALTTDIPAKEKYSLCKTKLVMPTVITGQNGVAIKQSTNVAVQGCKKTVKDSGPKLSRAQLLRHALKECARKHKHAEARRVACEKQARKHYAAKKAAHNKGRG
jgi:hypothetical protein